MVAHLRGVMVQNSPYFATVITGQISPKATRIYGMSESMLAGSSVGLTIEARDAFDNRIKQGGGKATLSRPLLHVSLPQTLPVLLRPSPMTTHHDCLQPRTTIAYNVHVRGRQRPSRRGL